MDFDEIRRLQRDMYGAVGEALNQMRERDSVMRSIREMNSAASSLREMNAASHVQEAADSAARTLREISAARSYQDEAGIAARNLLENSAIEGLRNAESLGLRELDPRVRGFDARGLDRITGGLERREMDAVTGGLGLREMNLVSGGLYDQTLKYLKIEESIQRQVRQSLQDFERGGISSMVRELAGADSNWMRSVAEAIGQLSSAYVLARSSDFEELRRRGELLSDLIAGSPVVGMLASELARSASAGALTPALAGGFGAELLDYLEGAESVDSEEAAEKYFLTVINWLLELAQHLPDKKQAKKALIALLGFFLSVLITPLIEQLIYGDSQGEAVREAKEEAQHARQASEATLKKLEELEARLGEVQVQNDNAREYVVFKAANLRGGPGIEFESLKVLPPNVQVEELERVGEWMHVQYFDYAEGELRKGWIAAELLVEKRDVNQD